MAPPTSPLIRWLCLAKFYFQFFTSLKTKYLLLTWVDERSLPLFLELATRDKVQWELSAGCLRLMPVCVSGML